jgi:hypothetical protein
VNDGPDVLPHFRHVVEEDDPDSAPNVAGCLFVCLRQITV